MEKMVFEAPSVDIVRFDRQDIITQSGIGGNLGEWDQQSPSPRYLEQGEDNEIQL